MITHLHAFIYVADQASFAKAAKKLGLSRATLTRYIKELEHDHKSQFFNRTTRHVSLTTAGESFYQYALNVLELHTDINTQLQAEQKQLSGTIKIGMPVSIMHGFIEIQLQNIVDKHPELNIEIISGNHLHDLLSERFDLVIHCGKLPNINFYSHLIGQWQRTVCASPTYLKKYGTPKTPYALKDHNCLCHADNHTGCWRFNIDKKSELIAINGNVRINSSLALRQLAEKGLGIVYLPSFTLNLGANNTRLQTILDSYWVEPQPMYALYPQRKTNNRKVATLIEYLSEVFE